jgi:hypothetical protein
MDRQKPQTIILKAIAIILISFLAFSCDSDLLHKTPITNFTGTWKLQGRSMFNGIKIQITEKKNGDLVGKVVELNDNKYVNLFVSVGDIWVTGISRSSNTEFVLTEKKIASSLFSLYGLDTTQDYQVKFIDTNTFGLGTGSADPRQSSIRYCRALPTEPQK